MYRVGQLKENILKENALEMRIVRGKDRIADLFKILIHSLIIVIGF